MTPIATGSTALDELIGGGLQRGRITLMHVVEDTGKTLLARAAAKAAPTAVYVGLDWPAQDQAPGVLLAAERSVEALDTIMGVVLGRVDLVVVDDPWAFRCGESASYWGDDYRRLQDAWRDLLRSTGQKITRSDTAVLVIARDRPQIHALARRASVAGLVTRGKSIHQGIERFGHWVDVRVGDVSTKVPLLYTGVFGRPRKPEVKGAA